LAAVAATSGNSESFRQEKVDHRRDKSEPDFNGRGCGRAVVAHQGLKGAGRDGMENIKKDSEKIFRQRVPGTLHFHEGKVGKRGAERRKGNYSVKQKNGGKSERIVLAS